jgi:hypothetical protein
LQCRIEGRSWGGQHAPLAYRVTFPNGIRGTVRHTDTYATHLEAEAAILGETG